MRYDKVISLKGLEAGALNFDHSDNIPDLVAAYCRSRPEEFSAWSEDKANLLIERKYPWRGAGFLVLVAFLAFYFVRELIVFYCYGIPALLLFLLPFKPKRFPSSSRQDLFAVLMTLVLVSAFLQNESLPLGFLFIFLIAATGTAYECLPWIFARTIANLVLAWSVAAYTQGFDLANFLTLLLASFLGFLFAFGHLKYRELHFYQQRHENSSMTHAFHELEKAVPSHTIRFLQSERKSLEETMDTKPGKGCVISMDIAGSTKLIKHPAFFEVSNRMKNRCYKLMNENSDDSGPVCRGFRIKDTGDGFLCSVGYPYPAPKHKAFDIAHDLVLKFSEIFNEEMATLNYPEDLKCSMGIDYGELQGFFHTEKPCQYDINGLTINLATRYESLRKVYEKNPSTPISGNIVFISERVWLGMTPKTRQQYREWILDKEEEIRDDPEAKKAYFMIMPLINAESIKSAS